MAGGLAGEAPDSGWPARATSGARPTVRIDADPAGLI